MRVSNERNVEVEEVEAIWRKYLSKRERERMVADQFIQRERERR